MLDSANFNSGPVNITQSVTILAVPGALGSVVANNGDAIVVNAAGVSVTLRNLVIRTVANGGHGINFSNGTRVIVEGCEIYGLPLNAVHATAPNGVVTVKETTIRQNAGNGLNLSGRVTGNLVDSKVMHHTIGVNVTDGARISLLNSLITNVGNMGVAAVANGGTNTRVVIIDSVIKNTTNGAIDVLANASSFVFVTVARSTIHFANTGINVSGAGNGNVILDNNVIVHTNAGVNLNGTGPASQVFTRNNNTISFSGGANVINGALTALGAF